MERPLRRVLLTLDPSPESEHVFEQGRNVVRALFGEDTPEYRALRVIWEPASDSPGTPDGAAPVTAALERLLDGQGARDVTPRVRAGMPAGVILAEAREWPADLVVLGTTARTAEERLLTGSVCASVLRDHAGNGLVIPTLTARSRPPQG